MEENKESMEGEFGTSLALYHEIVDQNEEGVDWGRVLELGSQMEEGRILKSLYAKVLRWIFSDGIILPKSKENPQELWGIGLEGKVVLEANLAIPEEDRIYFHTRLEGAQKYLDELKSKDNSYKDYEVIQVSNKPKRY